MHQSGDDWLKLLEHYQTTVQAYYEAVAGLTATSQFNHSWQQVERARRQAELARTKLLHFAHLDTRPAPDANNREATARELEDLILGDQGQSGG